MAGAFRSKNRCLLRSRRSDLDSFIQKEKRVMKRLITLVVAVQLLPALALPLAPEERRLVELALA